MKLFISFVTLAVLATLCNSASLQKSSRANLSFGWIRPGDVLLRRANVSQRAIPNSIQYQDYIYRGDYYTNISAINAYERGWTQYARAYVISGGIGQNNISIRLQSARGFGFNYTIDIYGR